MHETQLEIAASAARWVVEEGLEYGAAKQRAIRALGLSARTALPGKDVMDDAVKDYIATFCADTQAAQLLSLRKLALVWMEKLAVFHPFLGGAVWHGTATHLSDIYLQLFCDDCKAAELFLIDQHVRYLAGTVTGLRGEPVGALSIRAVCPDFQEEVGVHLMIYDRDDVRGALKPDARGRAPRGDARALRKLLGECAV